MSHTRNMTLGELIDALAAVPADRLVKFDFGSLVPTYVDSYRGYYDQLAIGYEPWGRDVKAGDLLATLREADGKKFHGYKGGTYIMDRTTEMWVANYGESHSTAIIGVTDHDWTVVLDTGYVG